MSATKYDPSYALQDLEGIASILHQLSKVPVTEDTRLDPMGFYFLSDALLKIHRVLDQDKQDGGGET